MMPMRQKRSRKKQSRNTGRSSAELPEFENGDRFKMNLVNCAMIGAFILSMPERPDVDGLTDYYAKSMMTKPMKWFCRNERKEQIYRKGHCRYESHRRPESR